MAVAPASMADKIIVLDDDDDEESPQPSCAASASSSHQQAKKVLPRRAPQPAPTHITQSPFASAKKDTHVLHAENQRLFTEFVEQCSTITQDCPEVLIFLQTKHAKSSQEYLSSVEFRNTVGRCLTHIQSKRSKAFVYINELCTSLRQHAEKRRQTLTKVEPKPSTSTSSLVPCSSDLPDREDKMNGKEDGVKQEGDNQEPEAQKKAKRASRRQIAYLENLLKVYNDEICRLQQAELDLDDLGTEDSVYIQEHRLKRKMMKIHETLCELKNCGTLTGRVIEQRIPYTSTRYPEINRRIERFINSPEAHQNPPDYQDILQQVRRANERHNLCLAQKQLNQIAQEAFIETGSTMQKRRHQDLVFNFGSHLTDEYKPGTDPAMSDPSLLRRLRSNREVALTRLEEVVTRYANRQEDTDERNRARRLERDSKEKEANKSENEGHKKVNGAAVVKEDDDDEEEEEEEEDDDDDDEEEESSDPDIEEEIQASIQQDGPDGDENEDADEADPACDGANSEDPTDRLAGGEEGSVKEEEDEEPAGGLSPLSDESRPQISPRSNGPSPRQSPSQSEPTQTDDRAALSNGTHAGPEEPESSSNRVSVVLVSKDPAGVSPATANGVVSLPLSPSIVVENCSNAQTTTGTSPPPGVRTTRSQKRKREDMSPGNSRNNKHILIHDSEVDSGDFSCNSPQTAESTRADTPTHEMVSSSQSTPPPKKNKVNVSTQCDPDEVIILSDSE